MSSSVPEAVRGNAGIVAKVTHNAVTTPYDGDIKKIAIGSSDKDDADITFLEASTGETKNYTVTTTALFAMGAGSFWRFLWDNPGAEFSITYGPGGNAVATPAKPHFLMTVKASGKPESNQEARRSKDRFDFEYEFEVITGPTLVEA